MMISEKKNDIDRKLSLYFIFKHPIAFREFFLPQIFKKRFTTYYYQYAPALTDEIVWSGARGVGKSYDLDFTILQKPYNNPNEETLVSAYRRTHIKDRLEDVISYIAAVPYLRSFLKGDSNKSLREAISRTPIYTIKFKNNHTITGISVGDDPQAVTILGHHPLYRFLEESQSYQEDSWKKFQNTQALGGSIDRFYGVPNGLVDSPFYLMTHELKKFRNKRFRIPRFLEPNWNQELKREKLSSFGGAVSNEWLQEIEAKDGEPSFGVWNEADIRKNVDFTVLKDMPNVLANELLKMMISAKDYKDKDPNQVLYNLPLIPEGAEVILGIDAGYTSPTVILPFFFYEGKWNLKTKILLIDHMISDDQTEIIDYIADFYKAYLSIDCTSADGRDIATKLMNPKNENYAKKNYEKRLTWVDFRKANLVGYKRTEDKAEEIKEHTKNLTTRILREKFANSEFNIFYDEELIPEFISETQKKEANRVIISTPPTVHIPEAFRCFAYAYFLLHEKIENLEETESKVEEYEFQMPEYVETNFAIFGRGKKAASEDKLF